MAASRQAEKKLKNHGFYIGHSSADHG